MRLRLLIFCALIVLLIYATFAEAQKKKERNKAKQPKKKANVLKKRISNLIPTTKKATSTSIITSSPTSQKSAGKAQKQSTKIPVKIQRPAPVLAEVPDNHCDSASSCMFCDFSSLHFNETGNMINNSMQNYILLQFYKAEEQTYAIFNQHFRTWTDNWKFCYSINMQPVMFQINSSDHFRFTKTLKDELGELVSLGYQFWFGAYFDATQWVTCEEEFLAEKLPLPFNFGEGEVQECASIVSDGRVVRANCDDSLRFACQTKNSIPESSQSCVANCSLQKCSSITKRTKSLEDLYLGGLWVYDCDSYYLFSSYSANITEARDVCCSLGGKLASFSTEFKQECFNNLIKVDFEPEMIDEFWTSASGMDCTNSYRWCYGKEIRQPKNSFSWKPSILPSSGNGSCVSLNIKRDDDLKVIETTSAAIGEGDVLQFYQNKYNEDVSSALERPDLNSFAMENCSSKKKFICELKFLKESPENAISSCRKLLNITDGEFDELKNTSSYNLRKKCYVKCIMDLMSLAQKTTLLEYQILKFSILSEELTFSVFQTCGKAMNHTNHCEAAFRAFKCFEKQAPVFARQFKFTFLLSMYLFFNFNATNSKIELATYRPRECNSADGAADEFFFNTAQAANGSLVKGPDGKLWFKSKFKEYHNYEDAHKTCALLYIGGTNDWDLPAFIFYKDFKAFYDWIEGEKSDNLIAQTFIDNNKERWCTVRGPSTDGNYTRVRYESSTNVPLVMNFTKMPLETLKVPTFLYMPKGSDFKYKLGVAWKKQKLQVNYFYCQQI
ncbi:uncharacterized protein LOC132205703 [Neocloeon triangulifer]|uniref:uncharacterized protein LOC132205703 n=1 Tax=Neocloeon triangulifer TaxID=2078957 RepID=UPI00286F5D00|nr:uncharacterized protein LOC132205703 [Neocloeon triangulifer]